MERAAVFLGYLEKPNIVLPLFRGRTFFIIHDFPKKQ